MKSLIILGSTGSIGRNTLDCVRRAPERFRVDALVAHSNLELLAQQVQEFKPRVIGITGSTKLEAEKHPELATVPTIFGTDAGRQVVAESDAEHVMAATVGIAGLLPVWEAVKRRKIVLLANKESLVCAGALIMSEVARTGGRLIPVDSEHSSLFQLFEGRAPSDIASVVLTASGGPFRGKTRDDLAKVTRADALRHPTWSMGAKISIDSSTLVNKALEVIEAHWLFSVEPEDIEVVIHPQSIVHALIRLKDETLLAHMSHPDMRGPIQFALDYSVGESIGAKSRGAVPPLSLTDLGKLEFYEVDNDVFPSLSFATAALREAGAMPSVFNSANECAVAAFLDNRISYLQIFDLIAGALSVFTGSVYNTVEDLIELDKQVREEVATRIATLR